MGGSAGKQTLIMMDHTKVYSGTMALYIARHQLAHFMQQWFGKVFPLSNP